MIQSVSFQKIAQAAKDNQNWIVERRRHLHQFPEISFKEYATSEFLRNQVLALGLKPSDPVLGSTGFCVEIISPRNPEKFVVLRADMDALPIEEENDVEFRSVHPGVGHLCGHDTHCSMLLGALKILKEREEELPVSVRFFFQHAEEVSPGGALDFINAGLLEDVIAAFGLHVSPRVETGKFGIRRGPTMAGASVFKAVIRGHGGHGAAPHEVVDPVVATANVILSLQQIVSRRLNPAEAGVVSVCQVHGGTADNVVPENVEITGTIRSYDRDRLMELCQWVKEIITDAARTYGCDADLDVDAGYPPVINDDKCMSVIEDVAAELFGDSCLIPNPPTMGGEDFAYYQTKVPGGFVFLGVHDSGNRSFSLHHPKFLPDEKVLWMGSALMAAIPFRVLDRINQGY